MNPLTPNNAADSIFLLGQWDLLPTNQKQAVMEYELNRAALLPGLAGFGMGALSGYQTALDNRWATPGTTAAVVVGAAGGYFGFRWTVKFLYGLMLRSKYPM